MQTLVQFLQGIDGNFPPFLHTQAGSPTASQRREIGDILAER
jgi:hypothetical protein